MNDVLDLAAHRKIADLERDKARLQRLLDHFISAWGAAESAEIKAILRCEDLERRLRQP